MFKKVLVANRGEIAIRVMRACRELGIETVAVYSEADRQAPHLRLADEAYLIGPPPSAESYLRIDKIIEVAKSSGVQAIHPGYGFLAENPSFPLACKEAGLVFIGPSAESIRLIGSKLTSRRMITEAGISVVPGTCEGVDSLEELKEIASRIGFPLMLKAAAGGGGKGLRMVEGEEELASAYRATRSESQSSFGDATIYVEKYLDCPRHIEFQVLADQHGNYIHLGERECSIQRRHQKIIEESPSPMMTPELRKKMGEMAVRAARAVDYYSAGTVEFLVDNSRDFYFLEMNTRLQVEHPVTELVTGIDLVKAQLLIAEGKPLPWKQEDINQQGAAVECRIYAEDPDNNFLPSPGKILGLSIPAGPGIRDDGGIYEGYEVPIYYDPLLSKLISWGSNRQEAIQRMRRALQEYRIVGIKTNLPFLRKILEHPAFIKGEIDTHFIERHITGKTMLEVPENLKEVAIIAAALHAYEQEMNRTQQLTQTSQEKVSRWKEAGRQAFLNQKM